MKMVERVFDTTALDLLQFVRALFVEPQHAQIFDLAEVERDDVLLLVAVENDGRNIKGASANVDQQKVATPTVRGIHITGELGGDLRI